MKLVLLLSLCLAAISNQQGVVLWYGPRWHPEWNWWADHELERAGGEIQGRANFIHKVGQTIVSLKNEVHSLRMISWLRPQWYVPQRHWERNWWADSELREVTGEIQGRGRLNPFVHKVG